MNLVDHYQQLWNKSIALFQKKQFEYDHWIDNPSDTRRGITLLARPNSSVKRRIVGFLNELKSIAPDQYYYPSSDIHMTIMSIISCYSDFNLQQIDIQKYIEVISDCLEGLEGLTIHFNGVTASSSGVMVQGFPDGEQLEKLRNALRRNFKNSELEQSLDKRYSIQTAHLTVLRFKSEMDNPRQLIRFLKDYRSFEFGQTNIEALELVFNDWYQREGNTQLLNTFSLPKK